MSQQLGTKSIELTKVIHLLEDPLTVSQTEHHQTLFFFFFRSAVLKNTLHSLFIQGELEGEAPFCTEETTEEKPTWLCILSFLDQVF